MIHALLTTLGILLGVVIFLSIVIVGIVEIIRFLIKIFKRS